jgi:hypothetical protein
LVQVESEANRAQRERQIGVAGGRLHTWDKAEEVSRQNENKNAAKKGHELPRAMKLRDVGDEAIEPFGDDLADASQRDATVGNHRIRCGVERATR